MCCISLFGWISDYLIRKFKSKKKDVIDRGKHYVVGYFVNTPYGITIKFIDGYHNTHKDAEISIQMLQIDPVNNGVCFVVLPFYKDNDYDLLLKGDRESL